MSKDKMSTTNITVKCVEAGLSNYWDDTRSIVRDLAVKTKDNPALRSVLINKLVWVGKAVFRNTSISNFPLDPENNETDAFGLVKTAYMLNSAYTLAAKNNPICDEIAKDMKDIAPLLDVLPQPYKDRFSINLKTLLKPATLNKGS